ncbi:MAG: hypothetical protein AAGF71_12290 [Pseudomonadota bacterium]
MSIATYAFEATRTLLNLNGTTPEWAPLASLETLTGTFEVIFDAATLVSFEPNVSSG